MKIGIIGAGNMGGAIARGLSQGTKFEAKDINVSAKTDTTLNKIKKFNPQINTFKNNIECIKDVDIIVLAVKPWYIESVSKEILPDVDYSKQIIISVAAGITFLKLQDVFIEKNGSRPVLFRIIPNTAIDVLQGFSCIASINSEKKQEDLIVSMFNELGLALYTTEYKINAFMSISSCGIAYAFRYIRAAMEGGVEIGLYPDAAKKAVMQTLKGAVALLEKNDTNPETEVDNVTTPGGSTIKGLNEMEHNGFSSSVIKGLKASFIK